MGTAPVLQVIPIAAMRPSPYQYRTLHQEAEVLFRWPSRLDLIPWFPCAGSW